LAVSAGTAALQVVPQLAKTFSRDLVSQMTGPATKAATRTGKETGQRFGHQMGRQLERSGDDGARRFGLRFNKRLGAGFSASTKLASVAAGAIGGAFAAVQIAGFLKGAIDEAREAAKVGKQTAAVIKSTGGAAKISAGKVAELAESISNTVGVDDELIQSGENWLLTFKNVRDETGRGNQVFSRATQAAVDLAASMHQGEVSASGLHSANTMLGKALNDPIKGMTALAKAGVTFTKGQQDQIKALVASGDTLKAQKIILGEVESQVAGFAKASADPWQKMGVAIANVKEDIGGLLLPAISAASDFVTSRLIPAVKSFVEKNGPAFKRIFQAVRDAIGSMIEKARAWWEIHGPAVTQAFDDAKTAVFGVRGELDKTKQAWDDNATAIKGLLGSIQDLTGSTGLLSLETIMKRIGEEVRGLIKLAGLFSRAWLIASALVNDAANFMVATFLEGWRTIVRAAATTAEALHLPFAKALRKNEQAIGRMADTFQSKLGATQRAIDRLHGTKVEITARARVGVSAATRAWIAAAKIPGIGKLPPPLATGGPVRGPGTGTSDSIPAYLSAGEHVWTAKEVQKAGGHKAVERMRREVSRGYARGGPVIDVPVKFTSNVGDIQERFYHPAVSAVRKMSQKAADRLATLAGRDLSKAINEGAGALGGLSGPGGWRWQMAVLRKAFPGLQLISGFRPGAVTHATGRQSYHAVGRAVDVPPRMDVFNWIRGNYGKRTRELIFSPAGGRQIHNGQPHMYTGVTRADHWNHVHWAYDQGGMLPPGTSLATNNTGHPEPVGFDYVRLGRAVAQALRESPPQVHLDRQKVSRSLNDAQVWERRR
jgi:hypothetical protein